MLLPARAVVAELVGARARRSRRTRARRRRRAGRRARARGRRTRPRRGVAGHRVHAVHRDHARAATGRRRASSSARCSTSSWRNRFSVAPWPARTIAPVVDRLVGAAVHEDRALAGEHRDHGGVDVRDRREAAGRPRTRGARSSRSSISSYETRAAEQPRPAGVRAPLGEVLGDRRDDLLVEVEARGSCRTRSPRATGRRSGSRARSARR